MTLGNKKQLKRAAEEDDDGYDDRSMQMRQFAKVCKLFITFLARSCLGVAQVAPTYLPTYPPTHQQKFIHGQNIFAYASALLLFNEGPLPASFSIFFVFSTVYNYNKLFFANCSCLLFEPESFGVGSNCCANCSTCYVFVSLHFRLFKNVMPIANANNRSERIS